MRAIVLADTVRWSTCWAGRGLETDISAGAGVLLCRQHLISATGVDRCLFVSASWVKGVSADISSLGASTWVEGANVRSWLGRARLGTHLLDCWDVSHFGTCKQDFVVVVARSAECIGANL